MRNKLKQLVSLLLVATLTMVSVPASAGLADALDGMFMSNSTSGGAFTSQSRGGMVGGSSEPGAKHQSGRFRPASILGRLRRD